MKLPAIRVLASAVLLLGAGCAGLPEGRFPGLGPHARRITTRSAEAQSWFDQGLAFLYAFNHDEAIRSFERAAKADPSCAMAPWGIAVANGPHINNPTVDEPRAKAAWSAVLRARELAAGASPVEQGLIEAVGRRYADPPPTDRAPLDQAYAAAMTALAKAHPDDADVAALAAEALMDVHPWDLWKVDGAPQPWTPEILALLEDTMAKAPDHPLALHLYIHAVEGSPEPGKATAASDRLRRLTPGLGHLVHMPSHIDVRTGRWQEAIDANRRAIAADAAYAKRAVAPGFYRVYMAHNRHMLAFAAMMTGRRAVADRAAREMIDAIPEDFRLAMAPVIDGFFATPYELHLRFGRWEAMLAEPEPSAAYPITRALRRFARGVSLAALKRPVEARAEQAAFLAARDAVPKDAFFGNNGAGDLLAVAERMLEGEILFREGRVDESLSALREAVAREDALRYDEPPDWIQPVRHSLGAALMAAGKAAEAETAYREDLRRFPENGWSLTGLARSLRAQGREAEALPVEARFRAAWKEADVQPTSSCLCLPGER